jgi:hypothetical protein
VKKGGNKKELTNNAFYQFSGTGFVQGKRKNLNTKRAGICSMKAYWMKYRKPVENSG